MLLVLKIVVFAFLSVGIFLKIIDNIFKIYTYLYIPTRKDTFLNFMGYVLSIYNHNKELTRPLAISESDIIICEI